MKYVYTLRDPDGTPFYVGQSKLDERMIRKRHRSDATINRGRHYYFPRSQHVRALLESGQMFTVVIESEHESQEAVDDAERCLIERLGIENLTNVVNGGVRGFTTPDDVKEKLRMSQLGKEVSQETRKKLSEAHARRTPESYKRKQPFSDEHRRKLSEAAKRRKRGARGRFA